MKHQKLLAFAAAALTATTFACSQAPAPPTSPSGADPGAAEALPDGSTLKATAPVAIAPLGGIEISDLDPDLVIENARGRFVELPLSYVFEVSNGQGQVVYRSNPVPQGAGGRTTHEIEDDLQSEVDYTWRAYAVYRDRRGPMSAAASFKTLNRFGESCAHAGSPIGIVACRFEQHGGGSGMDHEELIQFMREVAYDLNQLNISDKGGFGLAIKTIGNNCLGYSCDIICEGHGNDQNQYDILIDESIPNWAEVSEVAVRQCEIIR